MEFTIYSVGDGAFLAEILNGLALLSNNGTFAALGRIGLLFGVLFVTIRGMLANTGPAFHHVAFGLLLFVGGFSVPATVLVEDVYVSSVRVVSNIPLGIAASGAMLSRIGYGVTASFEQAFSTPSMTQQGWNNSLHILHTARRHTLREKDLGKANTADGGKFWLSWKNYLLDCTLKMVTLQGKQISDFTAEPSFRDGLKYDSTTFYTKLFLPSGVNTYTCRDGYAVLNEYTNGPFVTAFFQYVLTPTNYKAARPEYSGVSSRDQLADALSGLGLSISPEQWLTAAVVHNIWEEAQVAWHVQNDNWTYAESVDAGMKQRQTSWIADSQFFSRMIRPMLTFVEAIVFAVAPLMVLMIGVGAGGLSLFANYIKMLFWIQLWWPLLAVVHLYTHFAITGKMDALATDGNLSATSLAYLINFDDEIMEWVGASGMLAAAVPGFALMIVMGGAVALSSLMGKMQGGDFMNEKASAPDALAGAPLVQQSQVAAVKDWRGHHLPGVPLKLNLSNQAVSEVSAAWSARQQAAQGFESAKSRASGETWAAGAAGSHDKSYGNNNANQTGNTATTKDTNASNLAVDRKVAVEGGVQQQDAFTKEGKVDFRVGPPKQKGDWVSGGISPSISAKNSDTATEGGRVGSGTTGTRAEGVASDKASSVGNSVSDAKSVMDKFQNEWRHGKMSSEQQGLVESAKTLLGADETYQRSVKQLSSMDSSQSFDSTHLPLLAEHGGLERMRQFMSGNTEFAQAVRETMNSNPFMAGIPDEASKEMYAGLLVATGHSPYGAALSSGARDEALGHMLGAAGTRPEGIGARLEEGKALEQRVQPLADLHEKLPNEWRQGGAHGLKAEVAAGLSRSENNAGRALPSNAPQQERLLAESKESQKGLNAKANAAIDPKEATLRQAQRDATPQGVVKDVAKNLIDWVQGR
ncbi:MAG: conjugal transfer protein TraG N-terminal domain-containing protein [Alphaproteobacteria bacterium]|nr:conjugal transfer protein TraG N-terminal domain-containing protein [Alphaproteobacteria bacterium]